jgi:hypothetical protein
MQTRKKRLDILVLGELGCLTLEQSFAPISPRGSGLHGEFGNDCG